MGVDANREPAPGGPAEANDDQHTGLNKAYLSLGKESLSHSTMTLPQTWHK